MNVARAIPWSILITLAWSPSALAAPGIRYVDASLGSGANDGSTWANAYQGSDGVHRALAAAASGDEIWVADGTYLPTTTGSRYLSFTLVAGVSVYGGFAGGEASLDQRDPAAHPAILSGDLAGDDASGSYSDNSYHVVRGANARLDGFTIRGGNADGFPSSLDDSGAGLLATGWGNNIRVFHCLFQGNRCLGAGGGAFYQDVQPWFVECRFEDNAAGTSGGALRILSGTDWGLAIRCVFRGNTAPTGSAIDLLLSFDLFLYEDLFHGNIATGAGGAIAVGFESYPWLVGSTLARNYSLASPAAGLLDIGNRGTIANSILYFNTGPGGAQGVSNQISTATPASYSCIPGAYPGSGNIVGPPLFASPGSGDFRLLPGSPCVDSGSNTWLSIFSTLDLDRTPRREDVASAPDTGAGAAPLVDMGAYESPAGLYAVVCAEGDGSLPTPCPCGNAGLEGRGCRNSGSSSNGAILVASGTAGPDTVALTASAMLPTATCVFLQGNALLAPGVVFGDGVRCIGGALKRIGTKTASAGVASYPGAGEPSISSRSALLGDPIAPGSMRWYQAWYRDPSTSFCASPLGDLWNISAGAALSW